MIYAPTNIQNEKNKNLNQLNLSIDNIINQKPPISFDLDGLMRIIVNKVIKI